VTMACHFFHPVLKCMITIAVMDFEEKHTMDEFMAVLFWALLEQAVAKFLSTGERGSTEDKFNPYCFVSDGQGSIWRGIRLSFGRKDGSRLGGREQTCIFHFQYAIHILCNFCCTLIYVILQAGGIASSSSIQSSVSWGCHAW
jgi:hypothetical protein